MLVEQGQRFLLYRAEPRGSGRIVLAQESSTGAGIRYLDPDLLHLDYLWFCLSCLSPLVVSRKRFRDKPLVPSPQYLVEIYQLRES